MSERLAKVFDEKACINITTSRGRYHRLQIIIHGDEELLEELQEDVGLGKIYGDGWHIESAQAEELLRIVAPYIYDKEDHVEVALKFRSTYGGVGELSGTILDERDAYMRELSRLNR